jgi:hypothetical protein
MVARRLVRLAIIGLCTLALTTPVFAASGPRVSGGGTFEETGQTGQIQTSTFTFNAITQGNGRVAGHLVYHWRAENTTWHVDINCLQVVGNQAALGGTLTKVIGTPSDPNFFEGQEVLFVVQDNGEGGSAPPDSVTNVFYNAPPCDLPGLFPLPPFVTFDFPISGNIQVQP